jgi:hypothetical protein
MTSSCACGTDHGLVRESKSPLARTKQDPMFLFDSWITVATRFAVALSDNEMRAKATGHACSTTRAYMRHVQKMWLVRLNANILEFLRPPERATATHRASHSPGRTTSCTQAAGGQAQWPDPFAAPPQSARSGSTCPACTPGSSPSSCTAASCMLSGPGRAAPPGPPPAAHMRHARTHTRNSGGRQEPGRSPPQQYQACAKAQTRELGADGLPAACAKAGPHLWGFKIKLVFFRDIRVVAWVVVRNG